MSETPGERQTANGEPSGETIGFGEPASPAPGSRTLRAGGAFLTALAGDLTAIASRLGRALTATRRRRRPPAAFARRRMSSGSLWRPVFRSLAIALFGLVSACAVTLTGATLWLVYGPPGQTHMRDAATPGSRPKAAPRAASAGAGPGNTAAATAPNARGAGAPAAVATIPPVAATNASGSSAEDAARREDRQPAATEAPAGPRCSVDLCSARYASFHAADCTYQPYGGGPRRLCEMTGRSADVAPPPSPAAAAPKNAATDTSVAEGSEESTESALPSRAGGQCSIAFCAAKYSSFHAADCTYQPYGGGPRRLCER